MRKRMHSLHWVIIYLVVMLIFVSIGFGSNHIITTIAEKSPLKNRRTVIIDAGHGGEDGGTTSCTGILESQYNLEIALRLQDLMHLLGMQTVMIRESDISIYTQGGSIAQKKISDLKNRVEIANKTPNAILVSIHQNYYADSRYRGLQVFYAPYRDSDILARHIQESVRKTIDTTNNRQVKKASGIYLMQHINCPGILVECGFLSNREEEALLRSEDYQKKICGVIACCCSQYLKNTAVT